MSEKAPDQPAGYILILTPGYVEESAVSPLVLWYPGGFGNVEVGLLMVARALKEAYEVVDERRRSMSKRSPPCAHCGEPFYKEEPVSRVDLAEAFRMWATQTINDASDFVQSLMRYGMEWPQAGIPPEHWSRPVIVAEYADDILADLALGRTKVGKDSEVGPPFYDSYAVDWPQHIHKPDDLPWDMPCGDTSDDSDVDA
jgi:hypothetical protein